MILSAFVETVVTLKPAAVVTLALAAETAWLVLAPEHRMFEPPVEVQLA